MLADGRYRFLQLLGRGGMGMVWKVWDERLGREVALKEIQGEAAADPETAQRFLREARLAARLRHEGIVPVHDVGEDGGRRYLTMALVSGGTLAARWAGRRPSTAEGRSLLRSEVELLAAVADVVAYAHAQGVVHRDLKPANVLLDEQGRGLVADFGLAREISVGADAAGITRTGAVLGTPAYMSPEQANGDPTQVGSPTDVWSLGVMLYEAITGALPFEGKTAWELLEAVSAREPVPPSRRDPHVPAELEAICLCALERDPARRLSAAAFADDLRRWLNGLPVRVRPPGRVERLARCVRRHPVAVKTVAVALVVTAAVLVWIRGERALRERRAAHLLAESVREVEGFEDAMMRTRISPEVRERLTAQALDTIRRLLEDAPGCAAGIAWRGYLHALRGEDAEADEQLERACGEAAADPWPWYLRSRVSSARYRSLRSRQTFIVGDAGCRVLGPAPETAAETALRTAAMADLERTRNGTAAFADEERRIGAALLDLLSGTENSVVRVREALAGVAGPRAAALRAQAAFLMGDVAATVRDCDVALATWPEDLATRLLAGQARFVAALEQQDHGGDPLPGLDAAIAEFDAVLDYNPQAVAALGTRAHVRLERAEALARRGGDPEPDLGLALADVDRCAQVDPDHPGTPELRATILTERAEHRAGRGLDPFPDLNAALADFETAIRQRPRSPSSWIDRARALLLLAELREDCGKEPETVLERAIADCDEALRLEPGHVSALGNRANARMARGGARARRGEDARPDFDLAIADLTTAIAGGRHRFLANRGATYRERSRATAAAGEDPCPDLLHALDDLSRAVELGQDYAAVHDHRGNALTDFAQARAARGEDGREDLRRAIAAYDRALALNPEYGQGYSNRGSAHARLATWTAAAGGDPASEWAAALGDLSEAVRRSPKNPRAWGNRGAAQIDAALQAASRGEDPRPTLRAGIADLDAALSLDPGDPGCLQNRATALAAFADRAAAAREDPRDFLHRAILDYGALLRLGCSPGLLHFQRGNLYHRVAEEARARGEAAAQALAAAEEDLRAAVRQGFPRAWGVLGAVLREEGKLEEAIRAWEEADRAFPQFGEWTRARIEETRRLLEAR